MSSSDVSVAIVVAVISLISSIILAILNYIFNSRHNKKLEQLKSTYNSELEKIKHTYTVEREELKALRDYEYDARKRLYETFEPILFQLVEYSDSALSRIRRLVHTAKGGNLTLPNSWLGGKGYFMESTIYTLFLPLALYRILQYKLTDYDLDLVPPYRVQYTLLKLLYYTFSDDHDLKNELDYEPNAPVNMLQNEWNNLIEKDPAKLKRQGIFSRNIDKMTDVLISRDKEGNPTNRLISFTDFQSVFRGQETQQFEYIYSIFRNFHPRTNPILWRVLLVQLHIYEAIKMTRAAPKNSSPVGTLRIMTMEERKKYDWRSRDNEASDEDVLDKPYEAIRNYFELKEYLGNILNTVK